MTSSGRREVASLAEFHAWVGDFASLLKGDEILLLSGEMAAGKTEFTKTLGKIWGAVAVASPTFALHHRVESAKGPIDHFDLYRIENADELETTGIWETLRESSLAIIEWPERVDGSPWPRSRTRYEIQISKTGETSRRIDWRKFEDGKPA